MSGHSHGVEGARSKSAPAHVPASYRRLYEAYYGRILAYCIRRVGRQEAEDLAAEVFAVAWRRLDVVPQGGAAMAWLYGVAHRVVLRHWRTRDRRGRLNTRLTSLAPEPAANPDAIVVRHHDYELVLAAASRLRPRDREVLQLALWEELSHDQIATVLDSSAPAVRQRFHRAKRALAREFEKLGGIIPTVAQEGGES